MSEAENPNNTRPRVWKRIGVVGLVLLGALISLSLVVQIPAVQQWGLRKITSYLSEKTGSAVSVTAFDFSIFSHLDLKDVYFSQENSPGDTLLYAGELGVRFSKWWKLFGGNPKIEQVRLSHARLYVDDRPLTFLALTGKKKKSSSSGIRILDPEIVLDDVVVHIAKEAKSMTQVFVLPKGVIQIDEINTQSKTLQLNSIRLQGPIVSLTMKPDSLITALQIDSILSITVPDSIGHDTSKWVYEIQEITISDGQMRFSDPDPSVPPPIAGINYHDSQISELQVDLRDLRLDDANVTGEIRNISFIELSGFTMEHLAAKSIGLSANGIALGGLEMRTPRSIIMDTIALDFGNEIPEGTFAERANLYARFREAELSFADLLTAIPELQQNTFFNQNRDEILNISGVLRGSLDRLRGDSLQLRLGDMTFSGQFRSRNLTIAGKQVLNLVVNDARFTPLDLHKHIPGVKFPDQFTRLGRIQFQGKFDGFLEDFVAYGKINTDLGRAIVDMKLETKSQVANYSGEMSLQEFNLRGWTGIADLGIVSANLRLSNGSGLTAETAVADVSGAITQFQYKGYTYSDVKIDGRLNQNQFDGKMQIDDPNIKLLFEGSVVANQGNPIFDFTADIDHLDLQKLNLSKEVFTLSGVVVAEGQGMDINTLTGALRASDLNVTRGIDTFALDTLFVNVEHDEAGHRFVRATSDYINGWISGNFELNSLYPSLAQYLVESYPQYFSELKYRKDLALIKHRAEFEFTLNDPEEWGGLFNLGDLRFRDLYMKGILNFENDTVVIDIDAPELHIGSTSVYLATAHLESIAGNAEAEAFVAVIDIGEKYFFDEITASVRTLEQGFQWSLGADDLLEELNTLGLSGTFIPDSNKAYAVHIDPQIIEILDQKWELSDGNQIRFGKDFIELRDLVFTHDDEVISISDIDRRGILIETQRFDLSIIDEVWDYAKLDFAGAYTLRVSLADVFSKEDFFLTLDAPEVLVNGDTYGQLRINCRMERMGLPVAIYVGMDYPGKHLNAGGSYYPPVKEVSESLRNVLDLDVRLDTFPINFLEYFLKAGIRNTTGYAVGGMNISGPLSNIKMDGNAMIYDGATTVSYLGTRYFFDKQSLQITESLIDATGVLLTDELGNTATVEGGITHRALGKLGLNARIYSPRVLSLNTQKEDNSTYYGKGIGSVNATFLGSIERPSISIDAVTEEGTYIVINLADESAARQKSFIRFRDDETNGVGNVRGQTSITGMNFEMNMTATPAAVVEIILEDDPPESIIGSGTGDIQLTITRTGDFTMYGQYEIDRGNYLFRTFVIVNKPFELRRGGIIQWTGDPYNAEINLEADYVGLRASLSTFLAEYLTSDQALQDEAGLKTDVHLRLLLTGTLLEPQINFDFSFPNLSGELAGYADTKLRVLKSNQNALNEQVFGLLWAGSFLPSNILQSNASFQLAQQGITNTMSEFLSSQVSSLISGGISRLIGSDIDFDVNYSQGSQFDIPDAQQGSTTYREWEVRVKNRLFNDRVILDAGANYSTDSPLEGGAYLVGDYAIEYLLTKDGRLKIRFYHRNEQTIEGRKNKLGIGLAWRREFDSFDEWLGGLDKQARKLKEKNQGEDGGEGGG